MYDISTILINFILMMLSLWMTYLCSWHQLSTTGKIWD